MAKFEPFVAIFYPEVGKNEVRFHVSILPKWIQLYIMRFAERKGLIGKQGDSKFPGSG